MTETIILVTAACGIVLGYWDIGRRRSAQADLAHRAYHDPLTNLPNRALFMDRLARALAPRAESSVATAVMFLDVDDLKRVNDRHGHLIGDRLLVAIADRLRACLRPSDTVSRIGGDEFALLLTDVGEVSAVNQIARRIGLRLQQPFQFDDLELCASASIGVAFGRPGTDRPEDLLADADLAMYRVKSGGKDGLALIDLAPDKGRVDVGRLGAQSENEALAISTAG